MDEKEEKNETPIPEGITPPNCCSHTRRDFRSCGRNLDDLYNEKISNSIKIGFETLSNSLVECALILSSEDYAKSLVKEREDKKREEEAKKKEEEEKRKRMKEESERMLETFKTNLKDQIYSTNISDDEKAEIYHSLIADKPYGVRTLQSINKSLGIDVSSIVKKAFYDAIKEIKPEIGKIIGNESSMTIDPMMMAMIMPDTIMPPISFMALVSNDNGGSGANPMMMRFIDMMKAKNPNSISASE
jgi:hypothetical protein